MKQTELVWLYGKPEVTGGLKCFPEDFQVVEDLGFQPDGQGEHVLVKVRKTGCNTIFVAEQLAKFAKIPVRMVSYAGLKDRHAVTEQWFCLHLPGKESPDFSKFKLDGCEIISNCRHLRKLRIGTLRGNHFLLTIRKIAAGESLEQRLHAIQHYGVPNYFGDQRFGREGQNIIQAQRWAKGEIKVNERKKRGFLLSSIRSLIFNQIVSQRIINNKHRQVLVGDALQLTGRGSWFVAQQEELTLLQQRLEANELRITAPLVGYNELGTTEQARLFEQQQLVTYEDLLPLLEREKVESARRPILVIPQNMSWQWLEADTLQLSFTLPAGSYATSIVRELFCVGTELLEE